MTKYKLIDIGRNKVCREVEVKNEKQLYKEVCKHLMSREVDAHTEDDGRTFTIFAGFCPVGRVEKIVA